MPNRTQLGLIIALVIAGLVAAAIASPSDSLADRWIATRSLGAGTTFAELTRDAGDAYLAGDIRDMAWTVTRTGGELPAPHECRIADVHQIRFRDDSRLVTRWRPAFCNARYEPDLRALYPRLRSIEIVRK